LLLFFHLPPYFFSPPPFFFPPPLFHFASPRATSASFPSMIRSRYVRISLSGSKRSTLTSPTSPAHTLLPPPPLFYSLFLSFPIITNIPSSARSLQPQ